MLAAVVILVLGIAWFSVAAMRVRNTATELESTLSAAKEHAESLDLRALTADLQIAEDQSTELEASTSHPVWGLAAKVPLVGGNVGAIRTLAVAINDVVLSAAALNAQLPGFDPTKLRGSDGRLRLAALTTARPQLGSMAIALRQSDEQVAAIEVDGLFGPVADAVRQAQAALSGSRQAADLLAVLSTLLGSDNERSYAILLLNPAELRGGGGFFGGWAMLNTDHGDLTLESVGPNDPLVATGPVGVSSLPADYRALWGASSTEWQSVNISPNFPYAAQLTVAGLAKLGVKVDGVIALDSKVAAALLAGTGPVTAGKVTISSANADAYFTKGIYDQFPNGVGKDTVALGLFGKMFTQLTTGTVDVKAMASALVPLMGERRLLVWSSDPKEEAALAATPVGGQVPSVEGPWTTVALVNGAGNKMDAYLKAHADYVAQRCSTSSTPSTVTLGLTNVAPAKLPQYVDQRLDDLAAPKGSTMSLAFVYGPVGSVLKAATLDGKAVPVQSGTELGHPVWRFDIAILRGQTRSLVVSFTEPAGSGGEKPVVMAQPMAIDEVTTATLAPCNA